MRLLIKRRLLIKISLALLLVVCAVPFLLSKPRGQEHGKKEKAEPVKHDALRSADNQGAIFHQGKLGNFEPKNSIVKYGSGESGKPHYVGPERQNEARQGMMEFGINVIASDEVSMNRSIPDTRLGECKYWEYPEDLPKTSVIIVFHNEGWSPLLRTVHSVINRSPPQFLEEVLLVDDFSDKDHLKGPLNDYIRQFNGKVRLIRNTEREGLIRTRSKGAEEARGEVILFLDAHCEVNVNWLPPLLTPIYQNRRMMTVPVIDGIDRDTLEYRPVYTGKTQFRGIFEWGMLYKETKVPRREAEQHTHISEPYRSPTHAGGLFAMNREYFLELGAYDPGLLVWGGENFELSFKIWQCGGGIVWVPCSRVGHIYRAFMPYNFGKLGQKKKGPLITLNYKRVVEVWMDEYAEYFYTREPLAQFLDIGDISKQLELRQRLKCKSFRWFMDNVAYDVADSFPVLPKNLHWGELQQENDGRRMCWDSVGNLGEELPKNIEVSPCFEMDESDPEDQLRSVGTGQCLDSMGNSPPRVIGVSHCHGLGSNQLFRLNAEGQLGVGERCIDADTDSIKLVYCSLGTVDGPWKYDDKTHMLQHKLHKKCVELSPQNSQLKLAVCDDSKDNTKWKFAEVHPHY